MRKLLLVLFLFCSFAVFSQSNATVVMPDLFTHFVNGYPPNTIIWLSYNNKFYKLEVQVDNTVNMSWVLADRSRYSPAGYLSLSDTVTIATKYDIDTLALRPYTETDPVWVTDSSLYYKKTYINNHFVPLARTLTINGTTYDLSANRSWTVLASEVDPYSFHKADSNTVKNAVTLTYFNSHNGVTSITAGKGLSGGTITSTGTLRADTSFLETKVHSILTYEPKVSIGSTNKWYHNDKTWQYVNLNSLNDVDTVGIRVGNVPTWSGMEWVMGAGGGGGSGKGQNNVGKNVNLSGVGVYNGKTDTTLTFRGINTILPIRDSLNGTTHSIDVYIPTDTLTAWWTKQNKGVRAYDTTGVHNTRLKKLERDSAHWNTAYDTTIVHNTRLKKLERDSTKWNTAYLWGQWHDTLVSRVYQDFGVLVSGSAPNYTIKADTSKMVTFGDTAIVGGKIQSKYQYKLRNGDKNGQLPYWDVGLQMWIPSQHMSWNDTTDIFTTKNIYAGGTITANTNLIVGSLKNILGNSYSDTTVVDSSGYLKRGLKAVYQYEIGSDAENNITVPFSLKSTTSVYYNGIAIPNTRWSGGGTTVLHVSLDTRKYDKIIIQR